MGSPAILSDDLTKGPVIAAEPVSSCPLHVLPRSYQVQSVDHKFTDSTPVAATVLSTTANTDPTLDILFPLQGTYRGPGFNTIFRPRNHGSDPFPAAINDDLQDNVLQLNLTQETWTFTSLGGQVPNRGLRNQADIMLSGVSYVQQVDDVGDPSGKRLSDPIKATCENKSLGIHTEPGLIMVVPPSDANPKIGTTISRMASIPHGTTINLQGLAPTKDDITTSPPTFHQVDITPFTIGVQSDKKHFPSQLVKDETTPRIPQDLSLFDTAGTITHKILKDPNTLLRQANEGKNITNSFAFKLSSDPLLNQKGAGTTNIAFLQGGSLGPNANVPRVEATFWFSTVVYDVALKPFKRDEKKEDDYMELRPVGVPDDKPEDGTFPVFQVKHNVTEAKTIRVSVTQIQYSQTVILDFAPLSWPHVSVATLLPARVLIPEES